MSASLSVRFINQSLGATSYLWDFGDGSSNVQENPEHTYAEGGAYVVTLTATGPSGIATKSRTVVTVGVASDIFLGASDGDTLGTADADLLAVP